MTSPETSISANQTEPAAASPRGCPEPAAALDAALAQGAPVSGFAVVSTERIDELDACAYELRHEESGARALWISCADENKAFAIGFKTPPVNDTGVFHILEHSVLNGSLKFPVKEPFVDLIKTSMQTFLNAMTYPDKTVYPVASTNEQDLLNLMDVYMDAVLNPAIYLKPAIFEQEGWHYELDVPEGGSVRDGRLRVNGVVYNEMKGALSDPSDVLDCAVSRALFPRTAYACESGGNPRHIPELSYEEFVTTHARHYNLKNSYIVLYGNLHIERELAFLHENYLSDAAHEAAENAKRASGTAADVDLEAARAAGPYPLEPSEPTVCARETVRMATTPENAQAGLSYVIGNVLDRERVIAADVLFETLLGSNEAPVKRAILDAGLGGDVQSYTQAACLQPYELILLRGAEEDAAERLRSVVLDTCRELVQTGIPRDRLEATISSNEYDLRQRDYGMADGVVLALDALSTWLYSDDAATLALKYRQIFTDLRAHLGDRYFEELLEELVLKSEHWALVDLVPDAEGAGDPEEERLAARKDAMTDAELEKIVAAEQELRRAQNEPDAPEDRAKLPRLTVADVGAAAPEPDFAVDTCAPVPCLKHAIPTNRLAYALAYFDLGCLSYQELPYATILARLLTRLATDRMDAGELDSYVKSNLGFLSFATEVYSPADARLAAPKFVVSAGALSEKIELLAKIPQEIWSTTRFDDEGKILDVLMQMRINMEQSFLNAGHSAALARALSYVSPAQVVRERLGGVDFYRFLRDLIEHYDERSSELAAKLRELSERIFVSDGAMASFTGSEDDYRRYWAAAGDLGLSPRTAPAKELFVPVPEDKHEAFAIPSDICFCAQAHDPRLLGIATSGAWSVAANALSYDYLWNEIRVKGGAYGCGFRVLADRQLAFYSYRDPAVDPTIRRFAEAGSWLSAFDPDRAAFEGFIVSSVAAHDAPVKPYGLARRQDGAYFSRRASDFREKYRAQILATTPDELRAIGRSATAMAEAAPTCVFGARELLEQSSEGYTIIDLLS